LNANDNVILSPPDSLSDGVTVHVTTPKAQEGAKS
jgi:hypothetical protein